MTSCCKAFKEFYQLKDLYQLSGLPGCHGNQQCLNIPILPISFLIYGVERQIRYQSDAVKGLYPMRSIMLFLWLPSCHGNYRCPQNVPKVERQMRYQIDEL